MIAAALAGLVVAFGLTTVIWLYSLTQKDVSVIDIFWGPGFALLAWVYYAHGSGATARQVLVPVLVSLWALRLAVHIAWRSRGQNEDYRYTEMRRRWGRRFPLVSLPIVFWLQAALMWVIAMPLLQVQLSEQSSTLGWIDWLGIALFAVGFSFEAVGDLQLTRFKADPGNKGRVLDSGLWRYTRHPNYFGDATLWWGLWLITAATRSTLWTILSPALMTFLLLKVSGVTLLEKGLERKKPAYHDYVRRTSAFVPWPPRR